ncbi:hypothetical protein BFW01_g4710 [Lasiodiplodia theobromae]|nr:hypothetical protein BFW01_g4710 [Lasiodiplodia theobromae]
MQEGILCAATKKPTTDPSVATREYIQHLESQQARLVSALRLLARPPHDLDDAQREDIVNILKNSGVKESAARMLAFRDAGDDTQDEIRGLKRRKTERNDTDASIEADPPENLPVMSSLAVNQDSNPVFTPSQAEDSKPLFQQDQELSDLLVAFDDPDVLLKSLLEQAESDMAQQGDANCDGTSAQAWSPSAIFNFDTP